MFDILTVLAMLLTAVVTSLAFRLQGKMGDKKIDWLTGAACSFGWAAVVTAGTWIWYESTWAALDWWYLAAVLIATWAGSLVPWFKSADLARKQGKWWRDFVVLTLRGVVLTLPISAVFWYVGLLTSAVWLLAAGASIGLWYELAWKYKDAVKRTHAGNGWGSLVLEVVSPNQLLWGFVFGLALCLPVIL